MHAAAILLSFVNIVKFLSSHPDTHIPTINIHLCTTIELPRVFDQHVAAQ